MKIGSFAFREDGQGLVEYGLLLILVAVLLIVLLVLLGDRIKETYCEIILSMRGVMAFPPLPSWCEALAP